MHTMIKSIRLSGSLIPGPGPYFSDYHVLGPNVSPSGKTICTAESFISIVSLAILVPHHIGKLVEVMFNARKVKIVHNAKPTSSPADNT